jgi:iron(III) transport system substrate-binding protein
MSSSGSRPLSGAALPHRRVPLTHLRFGLALVLLLLAACTSSRPTGAPPPQGSGAQGGSEWEQVVAAARREGRVSVIAPQGTEARELIMDGFQKRYPDIQVDVDSMAGNQIAPKLLNELSAGQAQTDLVLTGTTTVIEALRPADAVAPVRQYLVGPNAKDEAVWRGGKYNWGDDAQEYNFVFSAYVKEGFIYNPNMVNPAEFTSLKDLLDPKWRGKIVIRDPKSAGGGLAAFTFFYSTESLGKDFVQRLLAHEPVLSLDDRQILDWVAKGQYPIAIGPSNVLTNAFIEQGLPVKMMDSANLAEGAYITAGNGTLAIVRNPPHPNALKVFLDWWLSKEAQTEWTNKIGFASLRTDVPTDKVDPLNIPKANVTYQNNHTEKYVKMREEIVLYIRSISP